MTSIAYATQSDDSSRSEKLLAAKRRLNTFRASRPSGSASVLAAAGISSAEKPIRSPRQNTNLPLMSDTSNTCHNRTSSRENMDEMDSGGCGAGDGHRRQKSQARSRHRRGESSISMSVSHSHSRAPSLAAPFGHDEPSSWRMPMSGHLDLPPIPQNIITTPATPLLDTTMLQPPLQDVEPLVQSEEEEDQAAVKSRLTAFSFGARPGSSPTTPSHTPTASPRRTRNPVFPSLSSQSISGGLFPSASPGRSLSASASGSNTNLFQTPSRPPSLLFTSPSPLQPSTVPNQDLPTTPPPAHRKRHSHTRSSSISLPNLKLAGRPISLGIPTSPSFPSSPSSPSDNPRSRDLSGIGSRLKFEPSEAEKEKEEGRRRALEKLTGASPLSSPVFQDEPPAEIALPDLEDDTSSIASSSRPLSGVFGSNSFSFGRPSSMTLSSSTSSSSSGSGQFVWNAADDSPLLGSERWSFGLAKDEPFGFALDMSKRGSMTGTLAVLAEEDEVEEDQSIISDEGNRVEGMNADIRAPTSPDVPADIHGPEGEILAPIAHSLPTSGLRELHLVSSTPIKSSSIDSTSTRAASPTKQYGAVGRGRPRPLSGVPSAFSSNTSSPLTSAIVTPKNGSIAGRRLGSRGSSISYKKDESAASNASNRWSLGSRNVVSPPPGDIVSPITSPTFSSASWRSSRPAPRPKSLAGLGLEQLSTANRNLSDVSERDERSVLSNEGWRSASAVPIPKGGFTFQSFSSGASTRGRQSMDEDQGGSEWRNEMLELQMERDSLAEDVAGWKDRCVSAEERLDAERRETGVLRDRVRKLSDRIMTVSSVTPRSPGRDVSHPQEGRLVKEMRDQLFTLAASLEQERREKDAALARVAELERNMTKLRYEARSYSRDDDSFSPPQQGSPFVATAHVTPTYTPVYGTPAKRYQPLSAGTSPVKDEDTAVGAEGEEKDSRMRAWGFPRGPTSLLKKENKRESFFGLSRDLSFDISGREGESEEDEADGYEGGHGVDLPPFILPGAAHVDARGNSGVENGTGIDAGPDALAVAMMGDSCSFGRMVHSDEGKVQLPSMLYYQPVPVASDVDVDVERATRKKQTEREARSGPVKVLDFTKACRCCVGQVFEV